MNKLKIIFFLPWILFICSICFASQKETSYFKHICNGLELAQDKSIIYRNKQGDSIANIQAVETYKQFITCKSKSPDLKMNDKYEPMLNDLHKEYRRASNLSNQETSLLQEKIVRIFNQTRNHYLKLIDTLENTSQPEKTKNFYRDIKLRITKVRLIKPKACNMHNAAYDPLSHSIKFCNEILNYPESTLVSVIAHELTHAIDPCILQFTLSEIVGSNPFFKSNAVINNSELENAFTTIPFEWAESDFFITIENFKTIHNGISFTQNLFAENIQCLEGENSIKAQRPQNKLKDSPQGDTERVCSSSFLDGETQESFAELMAYEVLAKYLKTLPEEEQYRSAYEGVLNITANECSTLVGSTERAMREAILDAPQCRVEAQKFFDQQDQVRSQNFLNSHPSGQRRVDRLFLAQPDIQNIILNENHSTSTQNKSLRVSHCFKTSH